MENTIDWKYLLSFSTSSLLTIFVIIIALILVLYLINGVTAKTHTKFKEREAKKSNTTTPLAGKNKK